MCLVKNTWVQMLLSGIPVGRHLIIWCVVGDEVLAEEGMVWAIRASLEGEGTQVVMWEQVQLEVSADDVCRSLVQMIRDGFPEEKGMMEDLLKPFFGMRE